MTPWMDSGGLLIAAGGIVVAASAVYGGRGLRAGLLIAGGLALLDAVLRGTGVAPMVLALLLIIVNALALVRIRGRGMLDQDARAFHQRHLKSLSPAQASLLIDQGSFIEARAGEVLTREGEPVENLHFLVSGVAAVLVDTAIVGRIGPGDLIGEAALLGDGRASATVRLAEPGRLWFIDKARLQAFLAVHPAIATELSNATMAALQGKLERANKARAEG
jgi:hypothetical protein